MHRRNKFGISFQGVVCTQIGRILYILGVYNSNEIIWGLNP